MDNVDSVLQRLRRDLKRGDGKSGTATAMAIGVGNGDGVDDGLYNSRREEGE